LFPGVVGEDGSVDRAALSKRVIGNPAALARLEAIVHPLVGAARDRFLRAMAARRAPIVVLDIPLMFEAGLDRLCDAVIVVSAPPFLQKARVMARPGMTEERLAAILGQQMPDTEKRRRADYVVPTGAGRRASLRRLAEIVKVMRRGPARRAHARSRS
jgi:dephospho-CoA kinase